MNNSPINENSRQDPSWRKKIALFLISQNISLFGSSLVSFSIIWYITLQTSSGKWVMLTTICALLPQVLISPWAGVWADRHNRKVLIMLADGFIALATLGLALAFRAGFQNLGLLMVVSAIRSLGAGIQTPAVNALYPQIVPMEKLTKVQGINQTLNSVLLLLSPAAGGVILGSLGIFWSFMADVITASLAICITSFIQVSGVPQKGEPQSVLKELKQGLSYTFSHPLLRRVLTCFAVSFFLITPAAMLSPLYIERTFGSDVWRLTANEMLWTLGTLIGGVYVSLRGEFQDKIRASAHCLVAFGLCFGLLGVAPNFPSFLLFIAAAGFFMPILATSQTVLLQENVDPAMMGRVFSLLQIATGTAMPVAILFFGPLADLISIATILLFCGALLTVVGLVYRNAGKGLTYR